ncbi:hypothetical protein C0Q44_15635 [Paenibacillus sp. PCH8]|uniref:hypothetical protein n=1 Tax=Paenibacillus sp. PCH8 TaxID=2066524 RepID=UPI000CFA4F1C|nr:hypothetical protein [Paenibacillus sp. PCH8]PQP82815.1 hypothetical protein C0Q44_15635 [Paenibacillus sp. PCH8]
MDVNETYRFDFDNLPPDEKAAWSYDHYQLTRAAIDKYFVSYGLDTAMIIGMMDRAREEDIRYQSLIKVIEDKVLPKYSRELNELESLLADLFDLVLKPLPKTNID